jgi:diguanylate cyclase (GGDEF)-like protein
MASQNDWSRSQSTAEDSFFDLLGETLWSLDRSVRGQFLAHFFKSFAQIELSDGDSAAAWDRALERHRELSESMSRPVSLKTALMDVLENMNLLRVPILIEYRELRKLRVNAATDPLTGLYNRRLFEEYFQKELSRSKRFRQQLALAILDLHRFKEVNDRYGHQQGDRALQLAAAAARDTVRASDSTFRIGGDEFAILLPQCDQAQCTALSWRLRARYEAAVKDLSFDVPLTLDFGIAVCPDDGEQREAMIRLADTRLYEMKNAARHQVDGTAQELLELRGATDALAVSQTRGETRGRDKRKWERVPMAGTSAHIVWNEGSLTTSPVIDVSYGGVALLVENPEVFPTSLQAVLHMPIQLPVSVNLRKSYEQRIQGAGTRVGCVFVT